MEITLSETLVNNLEERLIPSSEGIIIYTNIYKWSWYIRPSINKRVSVISIPNVKTALRDGLNSFPFVSLYRIATGGPPTPAIIAKIPENIPALNELLEFLSRVHPKYEARPANNTMEPIVVDKILCSKYIKQSNPKGPPTTLPINRYFIGDQVTSSLSLTNILIVNGSANKLSRAGTRAGSIWTRIGEEITAKPYPRSPWMDAATNNRIPIKTNS